MVETIIIVGLLLFALLGLILGYLLGTKFTEQRLQQEIPLQREDAIARSRAALSGKFSENLAPYFPDFPFAPTELRWLGNPVDYVVFKGMDNNRIDEIVFLEVKSGKSQLTGREKQIREAVQEKRISWKEYRVAEGLTK